MRNEKPIAVVLSVVFAISAQTDTSLRQVALGTPIGSIVEVQLKDRDRPNKLCGRIGVLDNQAFDLIIENFGEQTHSIPFNRIRSLKVVAIPHRQPVSDGRTLEETLRAIPKGTLVEVRFAGKRKADWVRGRFGQISNQEVQIQVFRSGAIEVLTLRHTEVESIKPVDGLWVESTRGKVRRGIGTGISIVLTGILVGVIVLLVAAKTGHVGG